VSTSPRAVAALLIAAALVAGVVLGVAGDRAWLLHTRQWFPRRMPPMNRLVDHLDNQLHFTPQQKAAVTQIIERHRQRIEAISAGIRPQMRAEIDATNAEIEKVLNPEQQQKFREISSHMRRHHRGEPGPPPH
jgi:hypothetical protein